MRQWLHGLGLRWFPVVGWAERGDGRAEGHGNSVPRFHVTWGTGPGVVAPFAQRVEAHIAAGRIEARFRHQVSHVIQQGGLIKGVSGEILAKDASPIGAQTSRQEVGEFEVYAPSLIVASGGIGGNLEMVRANWPVERLGPAPNRMVSGVPFHVDGRMLKVAQTAGGHIINNDRMWHYCEGLRNWDPIWPNHGIRILPGPSSLWFDAHGSRLPDPALPGFDTLGTLKAILATGQDYSWFILSQKIIEKEFALSGSEQNPDLTSGKWGEVLRARLLSRGQAPRPVEAFKKHGADFVVADTLSDLIRGMNDIGDVAVDEAHMRAQIEARDAQVDNPFAKDRQIQAIHAARNYRGDRLIRTAKPHRILDRANGPLIAVRLSILTRKTLGGLQTNLDSQMVGADGQPLPGLFAVGEAAQLWWRRLSWLQCAGRHLSGRVPVFRPTGGTLGQDRLSHRIRASIADRPSMLSIGARSPDGSAAGLQQALFLGVATVAQQLGALLIQQDQRRRLDLVGGHPGQQRQHCFLLLRQPFRAGHHGARDLVREGDRLAVDLCLTHEPVAASTGSELSILGKAEIETTSLQRFDALDLAQCPVCLGERRVPDFGGTCLHPDDNGGRRNHNCCDKCASGCLHGSHSQFLIHLSNVGLQSGHHKRRRWARRKDARKDAQLLPIAPRQSGHRSGITAEASSPMDRFNGMPTRRKSENL